MGKVKIARVLETADFHVGKYGTTFPKGDLDDIPDKPGVYALFWGDTLQYIGKSETLRTRLKNWEFKDRLKDENIPFGSYDWFVLPSKEVADAEDYLIKYYQPPYNISQR